MTDRTLIQTYLRACRGQRDYDRAWELFLERWLRQLRYEPKDVRRSPETYLFQRKAA